MIMIIVIVIIIIIIIIIMIIIMCFRMFFPKGVSSSFLIIQLIR